MIQKEVNVKKGVLAFAIALLVLMIGSIYGSAEAYADSRSYTIDVNTMYVDQNRESNRDIIKYYFTTSEPGYVRPVIYVDAEQNYDSWFAMWVGLYDGSLEKELSCAEESAIYEDANGHKWRKITFYKTRVPAGNYVLYFEEPTQIVNTYGHFKFKVNFLDESGKTNVEREFNNSRNTANKVSYGKTYYANHNLNDVDYFKFTLTKKSRVTVSVKSNRDLETFKIVKSNGAEVSLPWNDYKEYEQSNGKTCYRTRNTVTLGKGTYYLRFDTESWKVRGKDYTFMVTKK